MKKLRNKLYWDQKEYTDGLSEEEMTESQQMAALSDSMSSDSSDGAELGQTVADFKMAVK